MQIRINSLPAASPASSTDVVAIDGTTTRKATLTEAVNAGRPFASQAEAEAGTVATKGMSPLTTAQAITALGGAAFASIASKVPTGGAVDQVLGKTGSGDYAMSWRNAGAGDLIAVNNLADVANAATALGNLGGQPLDADLTAIAALTTATYGRSLLTLASSTALSGELSAFYQPLDADLTSWAGVTRAAGFDTFASGPTSANLKALLTDETGSGAAVFATSPTLVTPALGTPSALVLTNATGLPIAGGGTGQATAAAGFDALSPNTTRGDLTFRNATTNARLAASTAGYLLQTNGAGTDPTWAGFLQAGTSAVTRTWQNKSRESISVKDFGATGDGVTNDTAAIALAETYRASVGGELIFPQGTYLYDGQAINRANGGGWRGTGECKLIPSANSQILIDVTGAVISAASPIPFSVRGFHVAPNSKTGVTFYRESAPYFTTLSNLTFTDGMAYSAVFTGGSGSQTGWINIDSIHQRGTGTWVFQGVDDTHYVFNVNINNFNQQGTGGSTWTDKKIFKLSRAASVYFNNVNVASLDGDADGISMSGDCQGVFLNNVIIGWPKIGILSQVGTDGIIPSYIYMNNVGVDQPVTNGMWLSSRYLFGRNINVTNGFLRSSTGSGILIKSNSVNVDFSGLLVAYMNNTGLEVEAGATKVRVSGLAAENNNQIAGAYYDVDLHACTGGDVTLYGWNYVGTVNATGQRIVNGVTSKEVSRNTGSASTTAITTTEDLMTYTIPANTLKPGQKIRLTAWGTTAANANTKTIRLWLGANSIADYSGAWNSLPWRMTADIAITGASTQEYSSEVRTNALVPSIRQGTLTVTDTSAIIVKATGQNGTASAGDITCQGFTVEIID